MKKPVLEFPCTFPLKVMGRNEVDFTDLMLTIISQYVPELDETAVTKRVSSNGKYLSLTITFIAEHQDQLDAIYQELSAHPRVLMTL